MNTAITFILFIVSITPISAQDCLDIEGSFAKHSDKTQTPFAARTQKVKGPEAKEEIPFSMIDPTTGDSVEPSTIIHVPMECVEHGKKVVKEVPITAGAYYKDLNSIQSDLNKRGYTLNSSSEDLGVIERYDVAVDELQQQASKLRKSVEAFDPEIMEAITQPSKAADYLASKAEARSNQALREIYARAGAGHKDGAPQISFQKIPEEIVKRHDPEFTSSLNKSWDFQKGNPEMFAAYAKNQIELGGSFEQIGAAALAEVYVTIFGEGNRYDLLRLAGHAYAYDRSQAHESVQATLYVLGHERQIYSSGDRRTNRLESNSPNQDALEVKKEFLVMIGPVPVAGEMGVRGAYGVGVSLQAESKSARATVRPFVGVVAFANARAEAIIASAGVNADLTVAEAAIEGEGQASIKASKSNQEGEVHLEVKGFLTLTALKGKLTGLVSMYVPRVGIPPWKKKTWSKTLYEYPGIELVRQTLFNFKKIITPRGFKLAGAPRKEDVEDAQIDEKLRTLFSKAQSVANDEEQSRLKSETQKTLTANHALKQNFKTWLQKLRTEVTQDN